MPPSASGEIAGQRPDLMCHGATPGVTVESLSLAAGGQFISHLASQRRKFLRRTTPRLRLERATCCLGGTFEVWPDGAGCGLTCRSVIPKVARSGLAWPETFGRWLPVWLPETSLATLMFECLGFRADTRSESGLGSQLGGDATGE
jgi:hypothetical protein